MQTLKLPGLKPIELSNILYLAGDSAYTKVYTIDGKIKVSSLTLWKVHLLVPSFIRIHKSHLINPSYIESYQKPYLKGLGSIRLQSVQQELSISRRRWRLIESLLRERSPTYDDV